MDVSESMRSPTPPKRRNLDRVLWFEYPLTGRTTEPVCDLAVRRARAFESDRPAEDLLVFVLDLACA